MAKLRRTRLSPFVLPVLCTALFHVISIHLSAPHLGPPPGNLGEFSFSHADLASNRTGYASEGREAGFKHFVNISARNGNFSRRRSCRGGAKRPRKSFKTENLKSGPPIQCQKTEGGAFIEKLHLNVIFVGKSAFWQHAHNFLNDAGHPASYFFNDACLSTIYT